jgi:hypothetical protein
MPEPIAFSNMPSPDFVLPCEDGHLQTPHRIVDAACADSLTQPIVDAAGMQRQAAVSRWPELVRGPPGPS